ncbi:MAG: Hsp20/alpha crystallin family protein, partial [Halobacteriota archaeon]
HEAGLERYLESGDAPDVPASLGVESADYDLLVSEDEVVALVDLPGCEDGDVDVRMESGVLHVEARRRPTLEPGYRRVSGGSPPPLEAEIRVPSAVDAESASASFDGGVLRVRLPQI